MINGTHVLLYSKDPQADRAFFRDVLEFRGVDAGGGWLIFALPPAEVGIHPAEGTSEQLHAGHDLLGAVVYFLCDNLPATIASLQAKNVTCTSITEAPWGSVTTIGLPSGGKIGLYQPKHPTAIGLASE